MRRKTKFRQLAESEKEIGKRLAKYRNFRLWHQYQLAAEIGISRDQLASIEAGRVALTTTVALRIADVLQINLMWLAEGIGDVKRHLTIPERLLEKANLDRYFKHGYESALRDFFWNDFQKTTERHVSGKFTKDESRIEVPLKRAANVSPSMVEFAQSELRDFEAIDLSSLPAEQKLLIEKQIQLLKRIAQKKSIFPISAANLNLTYTSTSVKHEAVKGQWLKLKTRIQKATADAGSKSKLAAFLGVDLTQLSKWLTDSDSAREPGAEYTLQMQAWVNDPKRQ